MSLEKNIPRVEAVVETSAPSLSTGIVQMAEGKDRLGERFPLRGPSGIWLC